MATVTLRSESIRVEGLKQFGDALREVDSAFARELSKVHRDLARLLVDAASIRAHSVGGVASHAAQSLRASGTRSAATIRYGADHPEAMGAEFGGGKYGAPPASERRKYRDGGRGGHTTQFKHWRGNGVDAGYFIFPTLRAHRQNVIDAYLAAIERIAAKAFPG